MSSQCPHRVSKAVITSTSQWQTMACDRGYVARDANGLFNKEVVVNCNSALEWVLQDDPNVKATCVQGTTLTKVWLRFFKFNGTKI